MNKHHFAIGISLALVTGTLLSVQAQASDENMSGHNDYSDKANWLCWPGKKGDACSSDMRTTVIKTDGSTTIENFKANPNAPIDCFYVYPTASKEQGELSDMIIKPEEQAVAREQAARFASVCRVYAPMYRQRTLAALVKASSLTEQPRTSYVDVRDAWNYYLKNENKGRGVVLIGHSQGSRMLKELLAKEIDGKPVQSRLISAIIPGGNVTVAKGADVGGEFKTIPLCHTASQTGCVIAYSSFRDNSPPPDNSRFGRPNEAGENLEDACVNPAELSGSDGKLHSYLASGVSPTVGDPRFTLAWTKGKQVKTPFVSVPGLLTAKCVKSGKFNYLAIHINVDPNSPRTSTLMGDIVKDGKVLKDWGLHLIDIDLVQGNLIDIVAKQSQAWQEANHNHLETK
ncbi:DUF3089 domain-containing protein [Acinetobacter baumannii]|uniref:DUF3089 domain-containing protein n=1 Tax=Acinetobacter baumannii TaxID=470 RepID=UPI002956BBFC|nr:DUF3089 domain-containing protein [Acinetobacter baumannii]MDV7609583.1 DUF3089 domain-containing protein [Acinetobacter baumannii]MDV7611374.1 DUF3089 domain-containing protein [Acinetobacter baumannii]MDV7615561.1 DUF3089 domain-containing protein [Acinetobacter baumannii]